MVSFEKRVSFGLRRAVHELLSVRDMKQPFGPQLESTHLFSTKGHSWGRRADCVLTPRLWEDVTSLERVSLSLSLSPVYNHSPFMSNVCLSVRPALPVVRTPIYSTSHSFRIKSFIFLSILSKTLIKFIGTDKRISFLLNESKNKKFFSRKNFTKWILTNCLPACLPVLLWISSLMGNSQMFNF